MKREYERRQEEKFRRAGTMLTKEDVHKLFQRHEIMWSHLNSFGELTWDSFPWPMLSKPTCAEDITEAAVSKYVQSPYYPERDPTKTEKDHVREYIRRWHPDRFETKMLPKVVEGDKEKVKAGAGEVARALNEILHKLNTNPPA